MNVLASECSSRCESGWTLYLEQSFVSPNASHKGNEFFNRKSDIYEHEEVDLSMVSDASSGPPNLHDDEAYFNEDHNSSFYTASKDVKFLKSSGGGGGKRKKIKERRCSVDQEQEQSSFLDDTASSPLFNLSMNGFTLANNNQASLDSVLDFSQGFSATHFEGRSAFQDPFGFFQSSVSSGNQLQENH